MPTSGSAIEADYTKNAALHHLMIGLTAPAYTRFAGALHLNIHAHTPALDGVCVERRDGSVRLRPMKAPTRVEINGPIEKMTRRVGRCLERQGLLREFARPARRKRQR